MCSVKQTPGGGVGGQGCSGSGVHCSICVCHGVGVRGVHHRQVLCMRLYSCKVHVMYFRLYSTGRVHLQGAVHTPSVKFKVLLFTTPYAMAVPYHLRRLGAVIRGRVVISQHYGALMCSNNGPTVWNSCVHTCALCALGVVIRGRVVKCQHYGALIPPVWIHVCLVRTCAVSDG